MLIGVLKLAPQTLQLICPCSLSLSMTADTDLPELQNGQLKVASNFGFCFVGGGLLDLRLPMLPEQICQKLQGLLCQSWCKLFSRDAQALSTKIFTKITDSVASSRFYTTFECQDLERISSTMVRAIVGVLSRAWVVFSTCLWTN